MYYIGGAHWRNLAITIERPCAEANRPFCQITYDRLFIVVNG